MLKRPVNSRFNDRIRAGIKITTIREKPWPSGKPIMLYNWSGKPYGSPQRDVCAVEVFHTKPITITKTADGAMSYSPNVVLPLPSTLTGNEMVDPIEQSSIRFLPLWQCEGFDSQDDMDAWFRAVLKPGTTTEMHLCRFKVMPDIVERSS